MLDAVLWYPIIKMESLMPHLTVLAPDVGVQVQPPARTQTEHAARRAK